MSFNIGDRVGHKSDAQQYRIDESPSFGVVSDLTAKGLVIVTWDTAYHNKNSKPLEASKLMLESEILTAHSILENNFNRYRKDVEAKVQEAATALEEAAEIAKKIGCSVADMVYKSVLSDALYEAGWNGSSFAC